MCGHIIISSYLISLFISTILGHGPFIDYTENIELIQQRAGFDIKLQCGLKGLVEEEKIAKIKIYWYFKQCSENLEMVGCHDFEAEDWTQLPCEENFCKSDLLLHNVTDKYSGFYKCTVLPYSFDSEHTSDIKFVRTFQLDVKNTSISIPEFLDNNPLNKTATVGTQVVFQCRVHSEVHPTYVKWFRRLPELTSGLEYVNVADNFNARIVKYDGRTYELLSRSREKFIDDEIYLSKLVLSGVQMQDEGYYACVAINYRGHRIQEAYLHINVNDNSDYWSDYDTLDEGYTDPREFWLLFLMPVGLAFLPISVWLFYVIYKKCRSAADAKRTSPQYGYEEAAADQYILRV